MNFFLKTLLKYKASNLLNILGLTVALSAFYLIMSQVLFDFSFNNSIKDADRIYSVYTSNPEDSTAKNFFLSIAFTERAFKDIPEIESYGVYEDGNYGKKGGIIYKKTKEGTLQKMKAAIVYGTFALYNTFSFDFIEGNISEINPNQRDVITVSERFAKENNLKVGDALFGEKSNKSFTIVGIFKNFPKNSDFANIDIFFTYFIDEYLNNFSEWSFYYFLKIREGADINTVKEKVANNLSIFLKESGFEGNLYKFTYNFLNLKKLYFDGGVGSPAKQGNITNTYTLLAIAVLLIIISFINYINFFFALIPIKIRQVNTKRVFGCTVTNIRVNLVLEAVLTLGFSFLLSLLLDYWVSGTYIASLFSTSINFENNLISLGITFIISIAISLLGSIFPAYYITSFNTAFAIKKGFSSSKSGKIIRNTLIIFQFVISLGLIICAIFIREQHNYMMNANMGFNKENIIETFLPDNLYNNFNEREAVAYKIKSIPNVKDVVFCNRNIVAERRMRWNRKMGDVDVSLQVEVVSWDFLRAMGIKIIEGRDFRIEDELKDNGTFIFNEMASRAYNMGISDKCLGHLDTSAEIVGICENFNFRPMQFGVVPFAFYVMGNNPWWQIRRTYIKLAPNTDFAEFKENLIKVIKDLKPDIDIEEFSIGTLEYNIYSSYINIKDLSFLITLFTIISIIISLMGVVGLVLFEAQFRKREIGIRRVHGATISEILLVFNKKYLGMLAISFIIAVPISYIIMNRWISTFAYHITLDWWIFLIGFAIIALLVFATVSLMSFKVASSNPVESVKAE